ncbi:MAG TPA: chemotaxis protein [Clostridiales bacterium]|nr:chemotaxis protein [Clostridiales bacterium]
MKGTVVSTWVDSSRKLYGDKIVNEAMIKNGLSSAHIFNPLEDIDDNVAKGIVNYIGKAVNKSEKEIWFIMGVENIKTFSKKYPGFFRHESAYNFLKSMNDVHSIVVKRIKGSVPPQLDVEPININTAKFVYSSKRNMGDYLVGLISGVGEFFGEKIETKIMDNYNGRIVLELKFTNPIIYNKTFKLNQLLSFGLITSSAVKTALLSAVAILPLSFIVTKGLFKSLILAGLSFLVTFISTNLLNSPLKNITYELDKLVKKEFIANSHIHTNDEYEKIMENINLIKSDISYDFIGFNAIVDEMFIFNHTLSDISETMKDTSGEIGFVLEDVAQAAITQAEDTESAISVLDGTVKNVINVTNETQENKDKIATAVQNIEQSFNNVKQTAEGINTVLTRFFEIKQSGSNLKDNASNITGIVAIVAKIAKQINLLALNASIEAARAGEAGKGFVVVADEIKKLSEQTNDAVGKINNSLNEFADSIDYVVNDIDVQYDVLKSENKNLNSAINMSSKSNEELKLVSDIMVQTSQDLDVEVKQITNLFEGIQNLAAIAEENSASTEEASSNVTVYLEQIGELSNQINTFEQMIKGFQDELSKYII